MPDKTDLELTTQATVIYNETQKKANTANRVGQMFLDLIASKINMDSLDTDQTLSADSDDIIATQKAVKAYVDAMLSTNISELPGITKIWAGLATAIPSGYLLCDGAAVSRITYDKLFTAIGTVHGAGNGTTTFNLPNLKKKIIAGYDVGTSDYDATAKIGGDNSIQLTVGQLPKFRVKIFKEADASSLNAAWPAAPRAIARKNTGEGTNAQYRFDPAAAGEADTGDSSEVGNDEAIDIRNEFIVLPFIIKT